MTAFDEIVADEIRGIVERSEVSRPLYSIFEKLVVVRGSPDGTLPKNGATSI
jgi:hypothetical protein